MLTYKTENTVHWELKKGS